MPWFQASADEYLSQRERQVRPGTDISSGAARLVHAASPVEMLQSRL